MEEKRSFTQQLKQDMMREYLKEYNEINTVDAVDIVGRFISGNWLGVGMKPMTITRMAALGVKGMAMMEKLALGEEGYAKDISLKRFDEAMASLKEFQKSDPQLYEQLLENVATGNQEATTQLMLEGMQKSEFNQQIQELQTTNPEMYQNMRTIGNEMEGSSYSTIEQLQAENAMLYERIGLLQEQVNMLMEQRGLAPQAQERAGEEKSEKARAIYEQDGVKIEVAEGLQPESQQELQHGETFSKAEKEVTDEELEQAEKEVQERDAITEDGTVSIILDNSKKITISVEPYIAGDKETQQAKEANEQEQQASRDSASQELPDNTSRE